MAKRKDDLRRRKLLDRIAPDDEYGALEALLTTTFEFDADFQLQPRELLEILHVGEVISPAATIEATAARRSAFRGHLREVLGPVLTNAEKHGRRFNRAWGRVPADVDPTQIRALWISERAAAARAKLRETAHKLGVVSSQTVEDVVADASAGIAPSLKELLQEGLRLYAYNEDLSQELGAFVIRHRRRTDHRLVRVGREYETREHALKRPDRHVLHAADGIDVRGDGELAHYLLMRTVTEMKGKGRSSLGSALTGCYSTLLDSAEGKLMQRNLDGNATGQLYVNLLMNMVGSDKDPSHPKLARVVDEVLAMWRAGEKSLLFCFRINTAERLREIIHARIGEELEERRDRCLGGEASLRAFRARFSGRDRDLVVLVMDRVLWSLYWSSDPATRRTIDPTEFELQDSELVDLARLAASHRIDLSSERPDRVFLHRATEHILAARFLRTLGTVHPWATALRTMADPHWIAAYSARTWAPIPAALGH